MLSFALAAVACSDEAATGRSVAPPWSSDSLNEAPPPSDPPPTPDAPPEQTPIDRIDEGTPAPTLEPSPTSTSEAPAAPSVPEMPPPAVEEEAEPPMAPPVIPQPALEPPVQCTPFSNAGSLQDGDLNIDLATEFQTISGFGGINVPGWIPDLTPEQTQTAFGSGPGQLGLTILRVRIPFDPDQFAREVPTARAAASLGAKVFATPWTPPASLKTNNDTVAGSLARASYGAYADHLLAFRQVMLDGGVQLEAISVQNEPDYRVDYESCDWTARELADFLIEQGPRFGDTKLIAAESYNFNRQMTDPLLNDPAAAAQLDIVGGHIYGAGLADYPLARQRGKEVWMTEHYTDSNTSANAWPNALNVGAELHQSMEANFNAYVWWYIRRSYGLLTEDGLVSKRGYIMSQYARFVRPGYVRVGASQPQANGVRATAYKNGPGRVVVVAVNSSTAPQTVSLDVFGACVTAFDRFTTSETKNAAEDGAVTLDENRVAVTLDAQSVTTFVSR